MNAILKSLLAVTAGAFISTGAFAQERGTLDDAKAMVQKAKAFIKENGNEKAYAAISDPKGAFVKGDIYVYVYDKSGKNLAHGGNQRLIGKDLIDLKDPEGTFVNRGLLDVAQKGGGTFTFKFMNPATKAIESKTGYAEMVGDVMVGSGAYAAK